MNRILVICRILEMEMSGEGHCRLFRLGDDKYTPPVCQRTKRCSIYERGINV